MKYIKKILDNGMYVIMVPNQNTKIIAMGFFIKAGSRNESEENSGIAHFLEHMMFKGTINRTPTELFNELDSLGSVYNAATTTQYTYYYIYGNSDDIKQLLDIIFDIYINPEFDIEEINKEKKVIIEEMKMRSDLPLMKLYSTMHRKIFIGTSLSRNVIGNIDTIRGFKKKDLINFRKSLYKPENTIFVITGNFSSEPIYKIVEKVLSPLNNYPEPAVMYFNEKPIILKNMKEQKEPYVYIKKNTFYQQIYVLLAFPIYDMYSYRSKEIDLLSQLLSAGFSSRLYKSLRENNGITYMSVAYPIVYSDCGLFIIQIILSPTELINGIKIVLNELKKIKNEMMAPEEMKKIINVTKNEVLFSLIKPVDILTYFGIGFLLDRNFKPNIGKDFNDLKKITRAQVQKIAKEIFVRDKINLFMYGNIQETNYNFLDL